MAGDARPRPWRRPGRLSILSGRAASAPLRQPGARPPRGLPAALPACRLPLVRGAGRGEAQPGGGRGRHRGTRGEVCPRSLPERDARCVGHAPADGDARRAAPTPGRSVFGPVMPPGRGNLTWGRFREPYLSGFRAPGGAPPGGPSAPPSAGARGGEKGGRPAGIMQKPAYLFGTTTCGVDYHASHRAVGTFGAVSGGRHTRSRIRTSEN
jgi:hypothetical protein